MLSTQSRELGFSERSGGAWTWVFAQPPLRDAIGLVDGPGVRLAAHLGVPYVRLATAIPPELMPGDPGAQHDEYATGTPQRHQCAA